MSEVPKPVSVRPRRRFWASMRLIGILLISPIAVAACTTVLWHYCYQNRLFLPDPLHAVRDTSILVFAAIYAIPAGLMLEVIWTRNREISRLVLTRDKHRFMLIRDEAIPVPVYLVLAFPAAGILLLLGTVEYPTAATGEIYIFGTSITFILHFEVVLVLQNPATMPWFRQRIPTEWLSTEVDEYFRVTEGYDAYYTRLSNT